MKWNVDKTYDSIIVIVFLMVSLQFLFPSNFILPLDRRLSGLLGAAFCALAAYTLPNDDSSIPGNDVHIEVLLILVSIMVINFIILKQSIIETNIKKMKRSIVKNDHVGFWIVSFVSFIVAPFVTNDGLCLLLVDPVLDAFNERPKSEIETLNRFYFMLTISSSANIGSVTTFAGNPQNILIADSLVRLMSGGAFFGIMLLPALSMWFITAFYINYSRILAIRKLNMSETSYTASLLEPIEEEESVVSVISGAPDIGHSADYQQVITHRREDRFRLDGEDINIRRDSIQQSLLGAVSFVTTATKNPQRLAIQTWIALSLFAFLIVSEMTSFYSLAFIFSVIAVVMVCLDFLVPYYYGNLASNDHDNSQRRKALLDQIDSLFVSIDWNLIVIFVGTPI
jgi:di/tricarboxylate transporter